MTFDKPTSCLISGKWVNTLRRGHPLGGRRDQDHYPRRPGGPCREWFCQLELTKPLTTRARDLGQPLRLVISSVSCGATWNRSPTTPKSAISKIGASGSLLIATIVLDVCMPARCWIAPEMPTAMYSCGDTVTPVWPTCMLCGTQPASTTAREAPTAAPSESASFSMIAKLSAL